ncbi:MAG: class I SAM-dependent methyltransferase [Candidatus Aureabacteria bacterium]|nr:class I SAM-dependent methyltransferase [Candidatus Auribacterota bacterium]
MIPIRDRRKIMSEAVEEIRQGKRFAFGKNWKNFLQSINEDHIREAEKDLKNMLEMESLTDKSFLDVGSGSGLSSLAARRLGAKVFSFDYDPLSIACTREMKKRFFPDDPDWTIQEGSALDSEYIKSLGQFDIVYSWGVLHHTGNMWQALKNVQLPVKNNRGILFIAIYNDQGIISGLWKTVKKLYCSSIAGKIFFTALFFPYFFLTGLAADAIRLKNPLKRYTDYKKKRGMSITTDWLDWLGGYPFEVARPVDIIRFFEKNKFELLRLKTTRRMGNNQFVFKKS